MEVFYHPPNQRSTAINEFILGFTEIIEELISHNSPVIIMGGFNNRCTVWVYLHPNSELGTKLRFAIDDVNMT